MARPAVNTAPHDRKDPPPMNLAYAPGLLTITNSGAEWYERLGGSR